MKAATIVIALLLSVYLPAQNKISIADFKMAEGKWKGSITYLDYTSGKPYTMPCNISVSTDHSNSQQLVFTYEYPNEPKASGNDTVMIGKSGTMLDDEIVVVREKKKRLLQIITEKKGVDGNDNKKAVIRHIYIISKTSFIIRKEVLFEGQDIFILRNEYSFSR